MQQKYASQMIDDLNLIDEGLSRSHFDENGFFHRQQERMLFLGSTSANSAHCNGNVAIENRHIEGQASGEVSSAGRHNGADIELPSLFHRSFRNLLTALQKNIDFDQILRWARSVMEKCVIQVSQPGLSFPLSVSAAVSCQSATALSYTESGSVSLSVSLIAH